MFWLVLAAYTAVPLHLGTVALVGTVLGGRLEEVRLGFGPSIVVRASAPCVRVALFPGGFVRFAAREGEDPPGMLAGLSPARGALVTLSGPLVVLAAAAIIVGPAAAIDGALSLPSELLLARSPFGLAHEALRAATASLDDPRAVLGGALSRFAAFNLLPLPSLAGGQALLSVLPVSLPARERLLLGGVFVLLALFVAWALALGSFLLSGDP